MWRIVWSNAKCSNCETCTSRVRTAGSRSPHTLRQEFKVDGTDAMTYVHKTSLHPLKAETTCPGRSLYIVRIIRRCSQFTKKRLVLIGELFPHYIQSLEIIGDMYQVSINKRRREFFQKEAKKASLLNFTHLFGKKL